MSAAQQAAFQAHRGFPPAQIPERNTAVFNVLQDHDIALESPSGRAIW